VVIHRDGRAPQPGDLAGLKRVGRSVEKRLDVRRQAGKVAYAIATSKDRDSVDALLSHYGVADLFPAQLILDKEAGHSKIAHLTRLIELLEMEPAELTFVDDKVNHLDSVAPLGVRCGLATWGYNSAREHELAIRRKYLMLTLENVESRLFDGTDQAKTPQA